MVWVHNTRHDRLARHAHEPSIVRNFNIGSDFGDLAVRNNDRSVFQLPGFAHRFDRRAGVRHGLGIGCTVASDECECDGHQDHWRRKIVDC